MKVKELKEIIDSQLKDMPYFGELDVKVLVRQRNVIGARPSVQIINASWGFDHESGIILLAKEPIQKIK